MDSSERLKVWNMNDNSINQEYLLSKLEEHQKLVEGDLFKIHEVCLYWSEIGIPAISFLIKNRLPISNRILCFFGSEALRLIPELNSQEEIDIVFEYLYYCLEKRLFSVSDVRFVKRMIKSIKSYLKRDCVNLINEFLLDIKSMMLVNMRSKRHGEDVFVYINTSVSKFNEALQNGAGVMDLALKRDLDYGSVYEEFNKWDVLFKNGFRESAFYFPNSEIGEDRNLLDFKEYLKVCCFIASCAKKDLKVYFVGKIDCIKL